jgi:hypothetical protein
VESPFFRPLRQPCKHSRHKHSRSAAFGIGKSTTASKRRMKAASMFALSFDAKMTTPGSCSMRYKRKETSWLA